MAQNKLGVTDTVTFKVIRNKNKNGKDNERTNTKSDSSQRTHKS